MTEHQFETPQPVKLYVELGSGTVTVQAAETTESRVEITGRDADRVVVELSGDQLTVIAPKDRTGFLGGDRHLDIEVTVPTDSRLQTKTGSADLTARGRYSAAHLRSGSGDLEVDTIAGEALAETGSGDIRIASVEKALRIKSGSGDIVLDTTGSAVSISTGSGDAHIGTTSGPVAAKTGSGDVEVTEADADVSLTTGSGELVIGMAKRGRITAKGASGGVRVGIPAGVPVWTDVQTVTGRIRSTLTGAGEPEAGADYVEIRAKTVSGDIVLTEK